MINDNVAKTHTDRAKEYEEVRKDGGGVGWLSFGSPLTALTCGICA